LILKSLFLTFPISVLNLLIISSDLLNVKIRPKFAFLTLFWLLFSPPAWAADLGLSCARESLARLFQTNPKPSVHLGGRDSDKIIKYYDDHPDAEDIIRESRFSNTNLSDASRIEASDNLIKYADEVYNPRKNELLKKPKKNAAALKQLDNAYTDYIIDFLHTQGIDFDLIIYKSGVRDILIAPSGSHAINRYARHLGYRFENFSMVLTPQRINPRAGAKYIPADSNSVALLVINPEAMALRPDQIESVIFHETIHHLLQIGRTNDPTSSFPNAGFVASKFGLRSFGKPGNFPDMASASFAEMPFLSSEEVITFPRQIRKYLQDLSAKPENLKLWLKGDAQNGFSHSVLQEELLRFQDTVTLNIRGTDQAQDLISQKGRSGYRVKKIDGDQYAVFSLKNTDGSPYTFAIEIPESRLGKNDEILDFVVNSVQTIRDRTLINQPYSQFLGAMAERMKGLKSEDEVTALFTAMGRIKSPAPGDAPKTLADYQENLETILRGL